MALRFFAAAVVLLSALAGHSLASVGQVEAPDVRLVHYCDLRGECSRTHDALRGVDPLLPVRMATIAESVEALAELDLKHLPATVLYHGGVAVSAVVGDRRPALLRDELDQLVTAVRAGGLPQRATAFRTAPPVESGLVVFAEVRVRRGRVEILSTELFEGAAPKPKPTRITSHHVQLLDAAGEPLVTRAWQALDITVPPPPMPGSEGEPLPPLLTVERTAIVMPYQPGAVSIRIEQPFGLDAARAVIDLRRADRSPQARAVALHDSGRDDADVMVMLVMGDQYKKAAKKRFPTDAQSITDFILGTAPYDENLDNINVYQSKKFKGLKCDYEKAIDGEDTRLLVCNNAKVFKKAAKDKVAYDQILVLVNSEKYGGSGGVVAVSYNRAGWEDGATSYGWGPEVATHELGHSLLGLMDEYEYGIAGAPWGPNCQAPPCTWSGAGLGCHDGCSYIGLARPTDRDCYMNVLQPTNGFHLCLVGLRHARKVLEAY